jgi:hypothetical protein
MQVDLLTQLEFWFFLMPIFLYGPDFKLIWWIGFNDLKLLEIIIIEKKSNHPKSLN